MNEPPLRLISRPLLLVWTLWLLLTFFINLHLDGGRPAAATPAVRWMLQSALVGLMLIWPAFRLSQPTPPRPTLATVVDLAGLLAVMQLVIWPVRLARIEWTIEQTLALDLMVVMYATAAAIVVDVGRRGRAARRVVATAGCAALLLGGMLTGPAAGEGVAWLSPPLAMRQLSQPGPMQTHDVAPWHLAVAVAVLGGVWLAVSRAMAAAPAGSSGERG